jgi:hypothetical protein
VTGKTEDRLMDTTKLRQNDSEVVVKIKNGSKRLDEIIIRDIHKKIYLGGEAYHKYRIIRPRGHEKEQVFHREARGYEALLSEVFMILDYCRENQKKA